MNLNDARIVLTGAAGGIGREIALALVQEKARLLLVGRNSTTLELLADSIRRAGGKADCTTADLSSADGRASVTDAAARCFGTADVLINNAAVQEFTAFEAQDPQLLDRLLQINIVAPMLLTRALLPGMLKQEHGRIVNVGSIFGSIAFPYFAAYSAAKFALRGFSEALRRELDGTGVGVTYVAPRATRTSLNNDAVIRMNEALKVAVDSPSQVARSIVEAIRQDRPETYFGWPEKLFVRLNTLCPRLVDGALRKQRTVMRRYVPGSE